MKNKIMAQIGGDLEKFKDNSNFQKDMSQELLDRTNNVKRLIEQYDELTEKVQELEQRYEDKSKELFNTDKIKITRDALAKLKKQVFKMNVDIGVVRGQLSREHVKEWGDAFSMYQKLDKITEPQNDSFEI